MLQLKKFYHFLQSFPTFTEFLPEKNKPPEKTNHLMMRWFTWWLHGISNDTNKWFINNC